MINTVVRKNETRLNKAEIKNRVSKKNHNFAISVQAYTRKRKATLLKTYGVFPGRFRTHCIKDNKTTLIT